MPDSLDNLVGAYDPDSPLAHASTIPASWYVDPRIGDLERQTVFAASWLVAGRLDQLGRAGEFVTCELPGAQPVVVVRGTDGVLRGFYNVCRHHAAAVVTEPVGCAQVLRCPYHGWTYALDGTLKGTPDFTGVCGFDRAANGLLPVDVGVWEQWVFVRVGPAGLSLEAFLGATLLDQFQHLGLSAFRWAERRRYLLDCNWKVFVDNYLDGGYHVAHVHKGLASVLDDRAYTIENGDRFCLQWSPIVSEGAEAETASVRTGSRALYYWIYPNFMVNCYEDAVDTNLVVPKGVDRTEVIFDFFFRDVSQGAAARNRRSVEISDRIQDEDIAICASVQRGLRSGAYEAGRLSVRREAGEHLFHRLLHSDLTAGGRRCVTARGSASRADAVQRDVGADEE